MTNVIKNIYPKWLFWTEAIAIVGVYLTILNLFKKYIFEKILSEDATFIYLFILMSTLIFVVFLFTLLTDTYYNNRNRAYGNYVRTVKRFKRKGQYCSQSKYTKSLIVGFIFFISILVISIIKSLISKEDEIFSLILVILSLFGLLGFIKITLSGAFYSLLSTKKEENNNEEKSNLSEDGVTIAKKN